MTPTGVNLLNLSFVNEVNDLSIGPLTLTRSYISGKVDSNTYFGYSWTHNFDIWARQIYKGALGTNPSKYTEIVVGRTVHRFNGFATDPYQPTPENDETGTTVTSDGGAIIFNDRDGTVYRFDGLQDSVGQGQNISTITSPDGTVLSFAYVSNKLKTVTSNRGYALVFDYANGSVSTACGYNLSSTVVSTGSSCAGAVVKTSYGYNNGNLVSAADANGQTTQYQYTSYPNIGPAFLTCITDPGEAGCKVANTWTYRNDLNIGIVTQQVTADNSTWKFDCSCGANAKSDPDETQPVEWTSVAEPNGAGTYTEFTAGVLSKHVDENEYPKKDQLPYLLSYFGRLPISMTYPEGNEIVWNYNGNYAPTSRTLKAKPNSGLPDLTVDAKTYPTSTSANPATRDRPVTVNDANGNETDNSYTSFGAVDWTMQPPPTTGAARSLKLYTYAQKYAYVLNSAGSLVPSSAPIWLPLTETQCQTVPGVGPAR